ncbi:diiron oxygenase [Nocardioides sp. AE5]|uniref:AurF N-oxygenase family protein n=1 Tax=Nocardioides sp. AE5 TaxID=2962573 RepID=UPI002882996D|nr:diiron oxygenase [Nocardioides sp. AE5]MDT0201818.1 diiron oxygenase [Nocardioides sp. AE5]
MTITDPRTSPIPGHAVAERLLNSSARHSYDPEIDIDWDAPPVPDMFWMQPERMSLYGTPLWDSLSREQQITLSMHEVASIASVGLWFEIILMQLLLRDVYQQDPRAPRTHYALTEIADECRHSLMFGKAIGKMGIPAYGPRPAFHKLGRIYPSIARGAAAYASILIGEEPVDRWQRDMMKRDDIQPLTRMVARIHVIEEARHVTFARAELEREVARLSRAERLIAQTVTAQGAYVMMRSLVHPDVYASVGIDPREGRRTALGNPHYRATIAWMGEKVMPYLEEQGMVGDGHNRKAWRASFLLP